MAKFYIDKDSILRFTPEPKRLFSKYFNRRGSNSSIFSEFNYYNKPRNMHILSKFNNKRGIFSLCNTLYNVSLYDYSYIPNRDDTEDGRSIFDNLIYFPLSDIKDK